MESNEHGTKVDRAKRVQTLKKAIIGTTLALIIIPTLLCMILLFRICSLEKEIDSMLAIKNNGTQHDEGETTPYVDDSTDVDQSTEESTDENSSQTDTSVDADADISDESTTGEAETDGEEQTTPPVEPLPDGKYAYLTFDDGPSARTDEILDILDKYGVKGTFFVNGHVGPASEARYKAIVDRGHALGIHTYSHKYEKVYGGLESFAQEVESLRELLYQVTGVDVRLFRFPGGTSNSIVDDIQPYIRWINENGYSYHDWNCSSGDATGKKPSAAQIVENCRPQIESGYKNLVILMHDLGSKDTTVQALPALIELLKKNGYEIRAIDERSTPVHHREQK